MKQLKRIFLLAGSGILFFILGNNLLSLTNPDEVFYALSVKEMMQHGTWLVPYIFNQPHFEKPILFFWLLRAAFQAFGMNSFAARFVPAVFAIFGCVGTYLFCRSSFQDKKKAFFCAAVLMSSALYIALARVVMTDMVFSVFVALSLISFYMGYLDSRRRTLKVIGFFFFAALAVLTKGALGIIFPWGAVCLFLFLQRDLKFLFSKTVLAGIVVFSAVALPWYLWIWKQYGMAFVDEFFYNDHFRRVLEAEHGGNDRWFFYPLTIILGMFPWGIFSIAAMIGLIKRLRSKDANPVYSFLMCWIACVFVICQIAHSKLVSYILPVFPAVAILTGDYIWEFIKTSRKRFFVMVGLSVTPLIIISSAFLLVAFNKIEIPFKYYEFLPDQGVAIIFFVLAVVISLIPVVLAFKEKQRQSLFVLAMQIPLILTVAFAVRTSYEPSVSSQFVSAYLLKQPETMDTVLCSKMFARGVRYYTDKDIAVVGSAFFSPHPVAMLDSEASILNFLAGKTVVYAVVKKSDFEKIQATVGVNKQHTIEELEHIGDAYILKIR